MSVIDYPSKSRVSERNQSVGIVVESRRDNGLLVNLLDQNLLVIRIRVGCASRFNLDPHK